MTRQRASLAPEDLTSFLSGEHDRLLGLLATLHEPGPGSWDDAFRELRQELAAHLVLEQLAFQDPQLGGEVREVVVRVESQPSGRTEEAARELHDALEAHAREVEGRRVPTDVSEEQLAGVNAVAALSPGFPTENRVEGEDFDHMLGLARHWAEAAGGEDSHPVPPPG